MRLLELNPDGSFILISFRADEVPQYAILSHTWKYGEEYTFEDLMRGTGKEKSGYVKIQFCVEQAAKDGLKYFWLDTCCIDKSNNTELTTAINSMFRWYENAARCYVYLSDVSIPEHILDLQSYRTTWEVAFQRSRWFTRGWTLQELLAPARVEFFAKESRRLGDKKSLEQSIHEITGIAVQALRGKPLSEFSVAERLEWASKRTTTEKEDEAYCLLGVFGVYMPLIYGEGRNAFVRLRNKIDKSLILSRRERFTKSRDMEGMVNAKIVRSDSGEATKKIAEIQQYPKTIQYPSTHQNAGETESLFPAPSITVIQGDVISQSQAFKSAPSLAYNAKNLPRSDINSDFSASDGNDLVLPSPDEAARLMSIHEGKRKCLQGELPCSAISSDNSVPSGDAIPLSWSNKAASSTSINKGRGECLLSELRQREHPPSIESTRERHVWQHSALRTFSSPLEWMSQFQTAEVDQGRERD